MSVYIHCSIRICSVFDHFGYRAPDIHVWNHLTWYSEDRTLQWLQALRAELNPHLKRKLKKKITKAQKEDQAAVKAPKLKKKKKATATKSSAKAEKLVVRLLRGQQQLPFSQQLQTMAEKQTKPPSTSETSCQADDSSSDTQGEGDSARPSSSGDKTA